MREIYTDETKKKIYEFIGNQLGKLNNRNDGRIEALQQEIKKNESQIELFLTNFNGQSKSVNNKILELETLNERYEIELERLQTKKEVHQEVIPELIAKELDELEGLDNKPREEQRRIINKYIKKVVINEDNDNFIIDITSNLDKFVPKDNIICVSGDGGPNPI